MQPIPGELTTDELANVLGYGAQLKTFKDKMHALSKRQPYVFTPIIRNMPERGILIKCWNPKQIKDAKKWFQKNPIRIHSGRPKHG